MATSKKQLLAEFQISYSKFRSTFNKETIEQVLLLNYDSFVKMRILPDYITDKCRLYWYNGDTYIPSEGIYVNKESREKWAVSFIDINNRCVDLQKIDKYGMLDTERQMNVPFNAIKFEYLLLSSESTIYKDVIQGQ